MQMQIIIIWQIGSVVEAKMTTEFTGLPFGWNYSHQQLKVIKSFDFIRGVFTITGEKACSHQVHRDNLDAILMFYTMEILFY